MKIQNLIALFSGALALTMGVESVAQTTPGPQPTICNRACWGARAPNGTCGSITGLNRVIIHHTAVASHWNTTSQAASAANVRNLQNYDMDTDGYCDIEYHWMIDKFGNIFEARYGSMTGLYRAYHDACNSNSHGISFMAYFHPPYDHVPSQTMLNQMYDLIAWRMPAGWSPYGTASYCYGPIGVIDAHRKVVATACPGDGFYPLIGDDRNGGTVRNAVAARRSAVPVNNASAISVTVPGTVGAGQLFTAKIVMNNNGSKPWTAAHKLGSQTPQNNTRWGFTRVALPSQPINAGQSATFEFTATAPSTPGTYAFDWQMLEESVEWFGTTATATIVVDNVPYGTGTGLQGRYYDNMDFTGGQVVRIDGPIGFNWGTDLPTAAIGAETFSARWTGKVEPRFSETYTFYTTTDDGVRLWVNGQLLIDKWIDQGPTEWSGAIALIAGQKYDIRMDYFENAGAATAHLSWSNAREAKQFIQKSQLYVGDMAPFISAQPQDRSVSAGNNATFSVAAIGSDTLAYQWRFNGTNISGATLSTYTKTNAQFLDAGAYSVAVSNSFGGVISANALLSLGLVFADDFESGNLNHWAIASGATALAVSTAQQTSGTYSTAASSTQNKMYHNVTSVEGRARATFWIYDGSLNRIFGEARAYSGGSYNSGGLQQLYAIGKYSSTTMAGETYDGTKYQGRVVTGANVGWFNLNAAGTPSRSVGWHKFEIEVAGNGTTINFYVDGVLGRQITGASYYAIDDLIIGSLGTASTTGDGWIDDVKLEYFDLPSITTQPQGLTAIEGTNITLSVAATGNVSGYQWQKNGADISGATSPSLAITNAQTTHAGIYSVIVRNGIGPTTSSNATLLVQGIAASLSIDLNSISNGQLTLNIAGVPGYNYVLQVSTNMTHWDGVSTNLSPFTFTNSNTSSDPARFFRAVYVP